MADNEIEIQVENIGVSTFQTGLATAVNNTYSYKNNSLFFSVIPAFYRDYGVRYIKPACEWLDGYVPSLHREGISGIISTRIGTKLITGLTKQIVGEKLVFKLASKKDKDAMQNLKKVSTWANEQNITKAVYAAVGFALGIGTSLIKINKTMDQKYWWEGVRFDQCFYLSSFKNEIKDATFLIRGYTDTREGKNNQQFFLVEHRFYKEYPKGLIIDNKDGTFTTKYYKGQKVAMVEYKVLTVQGTMNNNLMPAGIGHTSRKWDELPTDIRKMIKNDFAAIRLDEPQELGLTDLGVQALLNGEIDLSVPTGTNFGESMLVGIQDDLITYELASSYLIRDMYLGKGTIYLPKSLSMGDVGILNGGATLPLMASPLDAMPDGPVEMLKGVDPSQQQAISQQFALRAAEWQLVKENSLKNIAVKWGMSPKILSSFLATGAVQMTATQIDSEDDMSIAFIYHTRAYFKDALNKLLETTLNAMGLETNLELDFASPSLINKDRLLDRTMKQLEAGFIDIDEAIRTINPDLDEEALQDKIDRAKERQQQNLMDQLTEMNQMGDFGNNYEDMGGENLKGSTMPEQ